MSFCSKVANISFQSHAGSIEALVGLEPCRGGSWFQSHAGSIEAEGEGKSGSEPHSFNPTLVRLRPFPEVLGCSQPKSFQSHAGSIEASRKRGLHQRPQSRFNPTLVRLRQSLDLSVQPNNRSFNPTLVRLRPPGEPGRHSRPPGFQSHAGSIEA